MINIQHIKHLPWSKPKRIVLRYNLLRLIVHLTAIFIHTPIHTHTRARARAHICVYAKHKYLQSIEMYYKVWLISESAIHPNYSTYIN